MSEKLVPNFDILGKPIATPIIGAEEAFEHVRSAEEIKINALGFQRVMAMQGTTFRDN